jgi:proline iminopeptidase
MYLMNADTTFSSTKSTSADRRAGEFYPEIAPFCTGMLSVSDGHQIYFEESGNPHGKPVLFVHGGPGGGTDASYRRFFNPEVYRIILFDQRGCGNSLPYASLEHNTTWDLVADMEAIRKNFGIEKWMLFGGSWGSTLAIAYAETHPDRVSELVLRGIFLGRKQELDWLYQSGASTIFPEHWLDYLKPIPADERLDMVKAYYARLTSEDSEVRLEAAKAWSIWEGSTSKLHVDEGLRARFGSHEVAVAIARIECHYFINNCFLKTDSQLLDDLVRIKHIPCVIVQGRYDMVCPIATAFELHRAWPEAEFVVVPDAGHSMSEPGIRRALIEAADKFAAA